jgi:transposase-like protein
VRYSSGMKAAIIKRILPPNEESVAAVSRETGVSAATIHYWKKQAAEGMLDLGDAEVRPRDRRTALEVHAASGKSKH